MLNKDQTIIVLASQLAGMHLALEQTAAEVQALRERVAELEASVEVVPPSE